MYRNSLLAVILMFVGALGASAAPVFTTVFSEYNPTLPYNEVAPGNYGDITVGGNGVDWVGSYWQAPGAGQYSIDMNRRDAGWIEVNIPNLNAGEAYKVVFALSGNPDSLVYDTNHVKQLQVSSGAFSNIYSFDVANGLGAGIPSTRDNMGWVEYTFYFTANGGGDVLRFESLNSGTMWGAVLGNVRIETVPEPSTVLLMGFGLAGLYFARRRRAA